MQRGRAGRTVGAVVTGAALALTAALPAAAAPGGINEEVTGTFEVGFVSEECGFPVYVTRDYTLRYRGWDRDSGLVEVVSIQGSITFFAVAGGPSVTLRNVGADRHIVTRDGEELLLVTGQSLGIQGSELIDLVTGEVLRDDSRPLQDDVEALCVALAG